MSTETKIQVATTKIKMLINSVKNTEPSTIVIPAMASLLCDYGLSESDALAIATVAYFEA